MRNGYSGRRSRFRAARLSGGAALILGLAVLAAVGTGGAAAAVGPTDLSLTKSDSPDPVVAGGNLTYTIKVHNPGPNDASGVVVTDKLPSNVDFVSATGGICQRSGSTVTCDLGQVSSATDATVTIVVKTKRDGMLSNTASVTSPEDAALANNSDTATTTVTKKPKNTKPKKVRASCAAPTISGTPGNDVLVGTGAGDVIVSFGGNDQIYAGGGKDLVCAGTGSDLVVGGSDGDTVIGGGGPDRLIGSDGGDLLKGKGGRDKLKGQTGNDVLNGGKGRDRCKGGEGRDTLVRCP